MTNTVVLIHGIWMTGREMFVLRQRLVKLGLLTHQFSYPSITDTFASNACRLRDFIVALNVNKVDFVCHSMGGLLLQYFLSQNEFLIPSKIALLGSPINGSQVACDMAAHRWLHYLLGKTRDSSILHGAPIWPDGWQIQVVAGNVPKGVGRVLSSLPQPNDGTVALHETNLTQACRQHVVPVTHTGLIFSRVVADLVGAFLTNEAATNTGQDSVFNGKPL